MPTNDEIAITAAAFCFLLWLVAFVRSQRRTSRQPARVEAMPGRDYIYATDPERGAVRGDW